MMAWFRLMRLVAVNAYKVYGQNRKRTRKLLAEFPEAFSEEDAKRIEFYTIQSCLTNHWFTTLRGYQANETEQKAALYMGAFTPLYDDLMDDEGLSHEAVIALCEAKPEGNMGYCWMQLRKYLGDTADFDRIFELAGEAQNRSRAQIGGQLSQEDLRQVSYDKGGYFTLLYRTVLQHPLLLEEEKAIYQLGTLLQLTNDSFDVWKDVQNGQQTLPNTCDDIAAFRAEFVARTEHALGLFDALPYALPNRKNTRLNLMLVLSRALVCLDQFVLLQEQHGHFEIERFSRKELICDMEKWENIRTAFYYCLEWGKER